jgi:RHS repeat-associated protein
VRLVIDDGGAVQNYYTYEPFGQTIESGGTLSNCFMFTGQYFDSEIEEYYLRARQYNPHLARFTSRDPIAGQFEQPLTLHRYLYCMNAPVNWIDPDGKWAIYVTGTGMASMGHSVVGQFGFAFDDDRNFDDITIAGYGAGTPSVSGGISVGFAPFADTIYDLEGVGGSIGGSYGPGPVGLGVEAFVGDKIGIGIEITVSASVLMPYIPGEIHGHATFTTVGGWSEAIADYIYEEKIYEAKTLGEGTAMLNLGAILDQ